MAKKNEVKMDKAQLDQALTELVGELTDLVKAEASALSKSATEDAPAEESQGSEGPTAPPEGEAPAEEPPMETSAPAPDGSASAAPGMEASAPVSPEQSAAAASPDGTPQHEQGEIEPAPTVEELQAEYAKLGAQDPEALNMHYMAAKQAVMSLMGADPAAQASAPAAAPPAPAAPPAMAPPEASAPMAPPMGKGEMKAKEVTLTDGNGGEMSKGKMKKSEQDVEMDALRAEVAAQKDAMAKQETALLELCEVVATPIRKSIKGISDLRFLPKDGDEGDRATVTLSKAEIREKLREKARDPKLAKADRQKILSYSSGNLDVSKIQHLLVDAAK